MKISLDIVHLHVIWIQLNFFLIFSPIYSQKAYCFQDPHLNTMTLQAFHDPYALWGCWKVDSEVCFVTLIHWIVLDLVHGINQPSNNRDQAKLKLWSGSLCCVCGLDNIYGQCSHVLFVKQKLQQCSIICNSFTWNFQPFSFSSSKPHLNNKHHGVIT